MSRRLILLFILQVSRQSESVAALSTMRITFRFSVLFDVCAGMDARVYLSSSATVYGNPAQTPITEECPMSVPIPMVGQSGCLSRFWDRPAYGRSRLNVVLLRYFNPIGAHKSGSYRRESRGIPNNLALLDTRLLSNS